MADIIGAVVIAIGADFSWGKRAEHFQPLAENRKRFFV
jgi:hypothetical protein